MNSPLLSFLGITKKSGNLIFGMDPVKKEISKGKMKLIIVTKDISENSLEEIQNTALKYTVRISKIDYTKDDINYSTGKYAAILGILNKDFSDKIYSMIQEEFQKRIYENNREECNL